MSNKLKKDEKKAVIVRERKKSSEDLPQQEYHARQSVIIAFIFFYFVVVLALTQMLRYYHPELSLTTLSMLYLPLYFIFIYLMVMRRKSPGNRERGKLGTTIGICMAVFIIAVTLIVNIRSWLGI
ncbi:MAG: hypothetical protein K5637_07515 [Lachnospiraceae bacterium]|nr:hypothetical protein [Lachnospiraceae bacterium]